MGVYGCCLFQMLLHANKMKASERNNDDTLLASTTDGNDELNSKYSQTKNGRVATTNGPRRDRRRRRIWLLHSVPRNSKLARSQI